MTKPAVPNIFGLALFLLLNIKAKNMVFIYMQDY